MRRHKTRAMKFMAAATTLAALTACSSGSGTDENGEWKPSKDVNITVAFPAGGGTDAAARALAQGLESVRDDINVVVINRDGGSGTIGYTYAAQQSKNPHELTFVEPGFATVPETTKVPFSLDDFQPVGGVSLYTSVIIAPKGKFTSLNDLLDSAEQESLTVGFPNATGPQAMSVALIEEAAAVDFEHIVYQNGGEIAAGVASGDLDFGLTALEHAQGFIKDGRVEAIAVLSDDRIETADYGDVPTVVEEGLDVSFSGFRGLVIGSDVSEAEARYWTEALEDYRKSDAYTDSLDMTLTQPLDASGAEFRAYLDEFVETVRPILGELGS